MSAILLMKHHTTPTTLHFFVVKMLMYAILLMKHHTAEHFGNQSEMSVPQDGNGTVTKGNVHNISDEGLHFL
jgi:hypothetical protein